MLHQRVIVEREGRSAFTHGAVAYHELTVEPEQLLGQLGSDAAVRVGRRTGGDLVARTEHPQHTGRALLRRDNRLAGKAVHNFGREAKDREEQVEARPGRQIRDPLSDPGVVAMPIRFRSFPGQSRRSSAKPVPATPPDDAARPLSRHL